MSTPKAGKFLLEILTKGMYSNPMHVYREYIQNSADAIDKSVKLGVLAKNEAIIHIVINNDDKFISIKDNALGISESKSEITLLSIGDSEKDGVHERGFRGIGRLGGLAYADEVKFITSAKGESVKTEMICNCVRLRQLLAKSNTETSDIIETFKEISSFRTFPEDEDKHYFEVRLEGIDPKSELLNEEAVKRYLQQTSPIDFDDQSFTQAQKIRNFFHKNGEELSCYKICFGRRIQPIYKLYSLRLSTGAQSRTKEKDFIRDVELVYEKSKDGLPLYIGWLALTDFSGSISDPALQGIRLRKGNILVGDNHSFEKFFPSEGHTANRMFAGEIHILHNEILPNSQRDDFEPGLVYDELKEVLGKWARNLNKNYRRGTSEATSALKNLKVLNEKYNQLEAEIKGNAISSDISRQKKSEELEKISTQIEKKKEYIEKALKKGTFSEERLDHVRGVINKADRNLSSKVQLSTTIANSDYATKNDLPSSYNRDERKIYQRIIEVIDKYFIDDPKTAKELRSVIKETLGVKKK